MTNHVGVDEVDHGQFQEELFIDTITGTAMFIRTSIFEKIGLLDEKYFLYFEESDFCQRAIRSGYKLLYVPNAVVWHKNAGSSSVGSTLHDYYITRNRLLFSWRFAPLKSKLFVIKQGLGLLIGGRKWQKIGARDYFFNNFGYGSYQ